MSGLPGYQSGRPRTDRPYLTCDSCGHFWAVWLEPAAGSVCDSCGSKALWAFPTVDKAIEQSRLVRGRR